MPRDGEQHRQVIPDVSEGREFFGYSVMSLMWVYSPAFMLLFFAQHYAPPGWGWITIFFAVVAFLTATGIIAASPADESPVEYAKTIYRHYTQQGVELHD